MKNNQIKLTIPFDKRKNAGIQSKITGRLKSKDRKSIELEKTSTKLKTSPVKINIPFNNNNPAQNKRNGVKTSNPKISIKKAIAAAKSIPPSIFTNIKISLMFKL